MEEGEEEGGEGGRELFEGDNTPRTNYFLQCFKSAQMLKWPSYHDFVSEEFQYGLEQQMSGN